ncbi:MAG: hypothetical protein ACRDOO_13765 [Actinomadura sp.]
MALIAKSMSLGVKNAWFGNYCRSFDDNRRTGIGVNGSPTFLPSEAVVANSCEPLRGVALWLVSSALVVVAAGCGGDTPSDALSRAAEPRARSEDRPWNVIPVADRTKFLAAMTEIDPRLTRDRERTLDLTVNLCFQIFDEKSTGAVRAFTQGQFASGATKVSSAQADEIVAIAKKWICTDRRLHAYWQT